MLPSALAVLSLPKKSAAAGAVSTVANISQEQKKVEMVEKIKATTKFSFSLVRKVVKIWEHGKIIMDATAVKNCKG